MQPTEGLPYDWSTYDAFFADPSAAGLTAIIIVAGTPDWAVLDPVKYPLGPIAPAHLGEFAAFVNAAVTRYSVPPYGIKYWELFNEPDTTDPNGAFSGAPWGDQGALYADMLQAVYRAFKTADPQATVLMGSVAYESFTSSNPPGVFNQQFIVDVVTELNRHPERGKGFDVFGFHYYALFAPVWAPYGVDILGKTNYLRSVLAPFGYGSVPMMCTEIGHTGTPGDPTSLQVQADYVPQVYARGMSTGIQTLVWYSLVVGTTDSGLLNADLSQKPAFQSYQVAASELGSATFAQTIPSTNIQLQGAPPSAFEGYVFNVGGSTAYRAVVWLTSGSGTLSVKVSSLTVTTEFGAPTTLQAGPDGTVRVPVSTSPVYLDLATNPWVKVFIPYIRAQ